MDPTTTADGFRAGFVALCGRPNVGKSTLLNALLGEEIAVATRFPQTTRERMLGIWSTDRFQAVLVDTPGIHRAKSALNKYMVSQAIRGAKDVELILMLAEAPRLPLEDLPAWEPGEGARATLDALVQTGNPLGLVITKCDKLPTADAVLPIIAAWEKLHDFKVVIPTSARDGRGLEPLGDYLAETLPEGPALYDPDSISDRAMRWHAQELVRGRLFAELSQELPYACAVTVERYKALSDRDRIRATIHVERASQKGMVIGKGGATIKKISATARAAIAQLSGRPCDLFLDVRVTDNWTKDPRKLESLGYREEQE